MATGTDARWEARGTVVVACNCDYGCPCNFNALPSKGKCEGHWTWHVEEGRFADTPLDGLNFTIAVNWPGAIHEGNGEALILFDERADSAQWEAISTLVGGDVGGPWGVLAWTWPKIHGPKAVPYEVGLNGVEWRVKGGESLEVTSSTIKNPVSGAEVHPGATLPEGIVFKRADFGASTVNRVDDGISFEHPGQYTAIAGFEYSGP
jgi:hypothetical protein